MFEVFEHTADLGLRVRASRLDQLLAEAARGLTSLFVANLDEVASVVERRMEVEGDAADLLLFDWLNELLYVFETEHLLFGQFEITLDEVAGAADSAAAPVLRLSAVCRGEAMDREKHQMEHEVKAITYHGLQVQQREGEWFAELIVDI